MSLSNELIACHSCSQLQSYIPYQCVHCLTSFCLQCLIKHHHIDVKNELIDMKKQIDEILAGFLYRAHNQTEWTNHLTEDQARLETFVQHIEKYYKDLPIITLPSHQWMNHIKSLISKSFFAINENCCTLMYPSLQSYVNHK